MSTFTNSATLHYGGVTVTSNTVTGTLPETLTLTKTVVTEGYTAGGTVVYVLTLMNPGQTDLTGLVITDDLGAYAFGQETLYPLRQIPGALQLFVNGQPQAAPAAAPGPPLVISGVTVPAGGSAVLVYETQVTEYAPLSAGESITNTAAVSVTPEEVTASAEVSPAETAELRITKALEQNPAKAMGNILYTFTLENLGNTSASAADGVILEDLFQPALTGLSVTFNGTDWTQGTEYVYSEATGLFTTQAGAITVPAADYVQDPVTGAWTVTPGTAVVTVTGTI